MPAHTLSFWGYCECASLGTRGLSGAQYLQLCRFKTPSKKKTRFVTKTNFFHKIWLPTFFFSNKDMRHGRFFFQMRGEILSATYKIWLPTSFFLIKTLEMVGFFKCAAESYILWVSWDITPPPPKPHWKATKPLKDSQQWPVAVKLSTISKQ